MAAEAYAAEAYAAVQRATKESATLHRLSGRHFGKVIDAYDGDTCRVAVAVPTVGRTGAVEYADRYVNVRMLGYDAPEMKKEQRRAGGLVKKLLHRLVLGKIVVLEAPSGGKPDPYGRVLGRLYVGGGGGGGGRRRDPGRRRDGGPGGGGPGGAPLREPLAGRAGGRQGLRRKKGPGAVERRRASEGRGALGP